MEVVQEVLSELGVEDRPMVFALNKIDELDDPSQAEDVSARYTHSAAISALQGIGIELLLERLESALAEQMAWITAVIPYGEGQLIRLFHTEGSVESEEYEESGTRVTGRIPVWHLSEFSQYIQ
jgi:GTP-binding protein HflX